MKREMRYLVMKYKDIVKYLPEEDQLALMAIASKIVQGRAEDGKKDLECVCVESDWPEYDDVWSKIAQRVDDVPLYKARMQQYQDYPEAAIEELKPSDDRRAAALANAGY